MNVPNQENKTQFIPNEVISCVIENEIFTNDTLTKYDATAEVKGKVIISKDKNKIQEKKCKIIINETFQDYKNFIKNRDKRKSITKDKWICDIIDGTSPEKSLYKDEYCIVIPTHVWDPKDISKLHILCIATDKRIRCIRSLTSHHIPLIEHMKEKTISIINELYNLKEENLKINLHYLPSAFQFHIHFVNVNFTDDSSSDECSYGIDNVLYNLSMRSNYYKNIILRKCV